MNDSAQFAGAVLGFSEFLFDEAQSFNRAICRIFHLKYNEIFSTICTLNYSYGIASDKQKSLVIEKDADKRSNFIYLFKGFTFLEKNESGVIEGRGFW